MNEELIRQVLEKYFSDFKEYHLLILIGFTVIIVLIQTIQSIWVSRKIESFKSDLKKTEIEFSKYNQLQIDALSKAYELLTEFSGITLIIKNNINSAPPEIIKSTSVMWLNSYENVYSFFLNKKYILPISIKVVFSLIIKDLHNTRQYVTIIKNRSSMYHTWETGEIEFMGDDEYLYKLHKELSKYDNEGIITKTIENIKTIQKEIENYFEKIEK
jgi:hypothetical protein